MKLSTSNIFKNIFSMFKNCISIILSVLYNLILKLVNIIKFVYIYITLSNLFLIIFNPLKKIFYNLYKFIYFIIYLVYCKLHANIILHKVFIKFEKIKLSLKRYTILYYFLSLFFSFIGVVYKFFHNYIKIFYKFFWKKLIDFLFFTVYRNKDSILTKFNSLKVFFIRVLLFYLLFYKNVLGNLHNFIFINISDNFIFWDLGSYSGALFIFLTYLNVDNMVILAYILVNKIGIYQLFSQNWDHLYLYIGYFWTDLYCDFKLFNPSSSTIANFLDIIFASLFNFISIPVGDYFFEENPLFFFFGILFFTTVILSWFFFSYLGLYGIFQLNLITLFFFLISLLYYAKFIFLDQKVFNIKLCSWVFLSTNVRVDYYFLVDTISYSFMLLTTTIAFFVFIYAFSYFRYEPLVDRFLLFILSFVVSMIFLVLAGNTIMLFLGWELIGFTSFCLINFWTTKTTTLKSAFKAFTFNKVSDFYLFMFLVASYTTYYTFDIQTINTLTYNYEIYNIFMFGLQINFLEFLAIMLIGAAFIKSAQLGGHAWLPDSMEAPVPASSLIHSATLVSAGTYLILRFNFIFDATQYSRLIIPVVGSLTAAYGGVCAIAQSDVKKTLAYSTISHCGFLMVLCAAEMNEFTILYLYVHGFFKAGVFMCVGNLLRITRGYQDNRRMGGLLKFLPFEYYCLIVGVFNLAGLPFTFGFFIKHLLLLSLNTHMYVYYFILSNCLVGAFSGLFYSYNLAYYTFVDFKKGNKNLYLGLNRNNFNSKFYTNSSLAATLSILSLFVVSYVIIFFLFKCLLLNNFLFSDFINTTLLSNYYSVVNTPYGYLLNFSYINVTVLLILSYFVFSNFRKMQSYVTSIGSLFSYTFLIIVTILFYSIL